MSVKNSDLDRRLLGEWLENQGIILLTSRGNQFIRSFSNSKINTLPDQLWRLTNNNHALVEWKAYSSPDYFRKSKTWQIGIPLKQLERYCDLFKGDYVIPPIKLLHGRPAPEPIDSLKGVPIYYGIWLANDPEVVVDSTLYFIPLYKLIDLKTKFCVSAHHYSSTFDKQSKLEKEMVFYDLQKIKSMAIQSFIFPIDSKTMKLTVDAKTQYSTVQFIQNEKNMPKMKLEHVCVDDWI